MHVHVAIHLLRTIIACSSSNTVAKYLKIIISLCMHVLFVYQYILLYT